MIEGEHWVVLHEILEYQLRSLVKITQMTYSNSRIKTDEIVTLTQTYFSCNQGCFAWCNIHAMYEGCFIIYFL